MDREKVIKVLTAERECVSRDCDRDCGKCELVMDKEWLLSGLANAITLLKKQKAKPMIENERGWNCPSCGMNLIGKTASGYPCDLIDLPEDEPIHFCPLCGQAVKWE